MLVFRSLGRADASGKYSLAHQLFCSLVLLHRSDSDSRWLGEGPAEWRVPSLLFFCRVAVTATTSTRMRRARSHVRSQKQRLESCIPFANGWRNFMPAANENGRSSRKRRSLDGTNLQLESCDQTPPEDCVTRQQKRVPVFSDMPLRAIGSPAGAVSTPPQVGGSCSKVRTGCASGPSSDFLYTRTEKQIRALVRKTSCYFRGYPACTIGITLSARLSRALEFFVCTRLHTFSCRLKLLVRRGRFRR